MKVSCVLFDLDGTLIDNAENILKSYEITLQTLGYEIDRRLIKQLLGTNIRTMASKLGVADEQYDDFFSLYRNTIASMENKLVTNGLEVLNNLKSRNIPLGIVTSKSSDTCHDLIDRLNLKSYFAVIVDGDSLIKLKPNPDPIYLALKKLNIAPDKEVLYLGDSISDMKAGINAGITVIGVPWGNAGNSISKFADFTITSLEEVLEIINS